MAKLTISERLKAAQLGLDSAQGSKKAQAKAARASAGKLANEPRTKTVEQHGSAK